MFLTWLFLFQRNEMWQDLLDDAHERGVYFNLTEGEEIKSLIDHVIINHKQ